MSVSRLDSLRSRPSGPAAWRAPGAGRARTDRPPLLRLPRAPAQAGPQGGGGLRGAGVALFGGRFTGTPNLGYGTSDGGAREYRIGWRLSAAADRSPGFELNLDATPERVPGPERGRERRDGARPHPLV